jgi:hypothetical protein
MRQAFLIAVAFTFTPLGVASSQTVEPRSGDRIRITSAPNSLDNQVARVLQVRSDTLFLQVVPAETLVVARAGVTRLEVNTAKYTGAGAVFGALVGLYVGALKGFTGGDDTEPVNGWFNKEQKGLFLSVGTTITGAVIGAAVGSGINRWTSVPLGAATATPNLQLGRRGTRLGVSVSF